VPPPKSDVLVGDLNEGGARCMSGPARRTLVLGPAEAGPFILAPQVPMTVGAAPGRRGNPPGGLAFPLGVGGHWGERRPYYKARGRRLCPLFPPSPGINISDDEIAASLGRQQTSRWRSKERMHRHASGGEKLAEWEINAARVRGPEGRF
jgi:hypothetical protein